MPKLQTNWSSVGDCEKMLVDSLFQDRNMCDHPLLPWLQSALSLCVHSAVTHINFPTAPAAEMITTDGAAFTASGRADKFRPTNASRPFRE